MKRILLIEDSHAAVNYITTILQDCNYIIEVAYTGQQAINKLPENEYGLVLLDIELPENISGIEVLRHIREKFSPLELPVITISANNDENKIVEVLNTGANDFINKPFATIPFKIKIDNLLQLQEIHKKLQQTINQQSLQNKQLSDILDNSPIITLLVDEAFTVKQINRTGQQLREGFFKPDMNQLGGEVLNCINAIKNKNQCGKTKNCETCLIRNTVSNSVLSKENIYKQEGKFNIKTNNNEETELELVVSATPIIYENKTHVLVSIDDVTNEKQYIEQLEYANKQYDAQAEELRELVEYQDKANILLAESEEKFKTIITAALDAIIMIDEENKVTFWNPAANRIFGYTEDEIIGKKLSNYIFPKQYREIFDSHTTAEALQKQTISGGHTFELIAISKDKKVIPVEISLSSINDGNWKTIAIIRDIHVKKILEQNQKQREKQLREILEYQPIPICLAEGRKITYINQSFMDFFGLNIEEIPDRETWFRKAFPDSKYREWATKTFNEDIEQFKRNPQEPITRLYNISCKNGEIKNVEISFNFLDELNICTFMDITKIIESENKLKELNLTKDKFISILAHDLKNPFNSLIGISDFLTKNIEKFDTERSLRLIKQINQTSRNTYDFLIELLEWARSQQSNFNFQPETGNLLNIYKQCILLLEESSKAKKIEINIKIEKNLEIYADVEMLKTILRNLVTNAIKFTPLKGKIEIKAQKKETEIWISVSDNGIGMENEVINTLFKIGETKSRQGTEGERGSGFGLVLCKDFVEKHGGKIWAESSPGIGSTFTFTLPI